jgi:hypothetical protein
MYKLASKTLQAFILTVVVVSGSLLSAASVPLPKAAPGGPANIFYSVNPSSPNAPVILFVHGLGTNGEFWFSGSNTMYEDVYNAGYRAAYISLSADNSKNTATIAQNAAMLQQSLPTILAYFGVSKLFIVAHSKGGLDTQAAMMSTSFRSAVTGFFMLAVPNQGAALADWAYGPGEPLCKFLGILSPGMENLEIPTVQALREQWDPVLSISGIPMWTLTGTDYAAQQDVIFLITGPVLKHLTGEQNDGLVATGEVPLPYATSTGDVADDHVHVAYGDVSWSYILPTLPSLKRTVATNHETKFREEVKVNW